MIQAWYAAQGIPLDVIVGVRHPNLHEGALGHAWVDRYDEDWSDRFKEIRRIQARDVQSRAENKAA